MTEKALDLVYYDHPVTLSFTFEPFFSEGEDESEYAYRCDFSAIVDGEQFMYSWIQTGIELRGVARLQLEQAQSDFLDFLRWHNGTKK